MSNASVQTASVVSGTGDPTDSRHSHRTARRRLFLLGFFLLVLAVGAVVNFGPVRHFQDARTRLEKVSAVVAGLEEQKATLQAQLAKLSEAGYLEGLAREELTYARPDEELYIVTEPTVEGVPAELGGGDGSTGRADAAGGAIDREYAAGEGSPALGGGGSPGGSRLPSAGIGLTLPGADLVTGFGIGAAVPVAERSGVDGADEAGLLERIVTAIAGLF